MVKEAVSAVRLLLYTEQDVELVFWSIEYERMDACEGKCLSFMRWYG